MNPVSRLLSRADIPNLTTMFGNLGHSWDNALPNDLYIKGVPKRIVIDVSSAGNNGAGLDVLHTYSLPAGSLRSNNDRLTILYGGVFANTANSKRVQTEIGGQVTVNSGLFTIQARSWLLEFDLVRLTDTTVRGVTKYMLGNINRDLTPTLGGNGDFSAGFFELSGGTAIADLDTNATTIRALGESGGAANNDVAQHYSEIWLTRF